MRKQVGSYGYYHISVTSQRSATLMYSNSERAFTIAQLQDVLSPRLILDEIPAHKQLASCIDLLAFSITNRSVELLVFSIDRDITNYFADYIARRVGEYHQELYPIKSASIPYVRTQKLAGPHQALARSVELHLRHDDWEYDRYSSVGFYLHDRRGDWMRIWRLANLYENDSDNYYRLLTRSLNSAEPSLTELQIVAP